MSSATPQTTDVAAARASEHPRTDGVVLTWSVHLLRRHPRRLGGVLLCVTAVIACGTLLFHNLLLAALPALALVLSLSEYVFPIRYTLSRKRVEARHGLVLLEMPWRDVRHAYLADDGIKLSPLRAKNSRFEGMRGIFLRFGDTDRQAVTEAVRWLREEARADG